MRAALVVMLVIFTWGACGGQRAAPPPAAKPQSVADEARARCCAQCVAASQRDPTGADISGKTCTSYPAEWSGGAGVDDDCRAWFVAQAEAVTVGDCR